MGAIETTHRDSSYRALGCHIVDGGLSSFLMARRLEEKWAHLPPPGSIIKSYPLPLPWYISVSDAGLYAASCALQYAASLSTHSKVVSLSIDNQSTMSSVKSRYVLP